VDKLTVSPLGREVEVPQHYDPCLLFPIARTQGRNAIGLNPGAALPFSGHDRWQAYELGWLDARGKPVVATATITVPATSPFLIESKSLKLYLNSLNAHPFVNPESARSRIAEDLSRAAGANVEICFGLPAIIEYKTVNCLDTQELDITHYGPPAPDFLHSEESKIIQECLHCEESKIIQECLHSNLFKSNCPVTGQPDWASIQIDYLGARIDHAGLLRYLVSFRNHAEFHEQCVERMFTDLMARCRPQQLSVEARYTRRGGLDINPWRATPGYPPPPHGRDARQ